MWPFLALLTRKPGFISFVRRLACKYAYTCRRGSSTGNTTKIMSADRRHIAYIFRRSTWIKHYVLYRAGKMTWGWVGMTLLAEGTTR